MRVSEIFYSIQGEGFLAGVPSVFIRLAGCPLRCRWCDTKYAWEQSAGIIQSVSEVIQTVGQWQCDFAVITGGEPMINSDVPQLVRALKAETKHVTIETAGIAYVPGMQPDLMSISPKLSNSTPADPKLAAIHDRSRLDFAVLGALIEDYQYQLKFVVDSPGDLAEIQQTISELGKVDAKKVMLMPQATTREELLAKSPMVADMCKSTGYAFCQRLQLLLYDGQRAK